MAELADALDLGSSEAIRVTHIIQNWTGTLQKMFSAGYFYLLNQTVKSNHFALDVYVYNALLNIGDIGMSSAAGFYQSIVGFIVIIIANIIVKKKSPENALF